MELLLNIYLEFCFVLLVLGFFAFTLWLILKSVLDTDRKRMEKFRAKKYAEYRKSIMQKINQAEGYPEGAVAELPSEMN